MIPEAAGAVGGFGRAGALVTAEQALSLPPRSTAVTEA